MILGQYGHYMDPSSFLEPLIALEQTQVFSCFHGTTAVFVSASVLSLLPRSPPLLFFFFGRRFFIAFFFPLFMTPQAFDEMTTPRQSAEHTGQHGNCYFT